MWSSSGGGEKQEKGFTESSHALLLIFRARNLLSPPAANLQCIPLLPVSPLPPSLCQSPTSYFSPCD
ncbi:hypothetical protein XELAEV_18034671mg [Xenopus laevis]|uniref:Uncharacterized protein n=1 Tax=Xenopus laevis TaxID=8355 RepID=A0A974CEF5_XENLA|nr:hypothetical protein XELAEV_18034671mg [Xenopus laevis]